MKFLCFTSSTQNPNINNLKHAIKENKNEHQSKHLLKFKVENECLKTQNEKSQKTDTKGRKRTKTNMTEWKTNKNGVTL